MASEERCPTCNKPVNRWYHDYERCELECLQKRCAKAIDGQGYAVVEKGEK